MAMNMIPDGGRARRKKAPASGAAEKRRAPTQKATPAPVSGGGDAAAARAREIQAQQEAARQRALEEAYRRQQEAAKKAKAEAANKKLDEANAAEAAKREKARQSALEKMTTYSGTWPPVTSAGRTPDVPVYPGPWPPVNSAGKANQEARNIQDDMWRSRSKFLADAQLKASASDPGEISYAKQLDFDKMSESDKNALMWNSMLDEALSGDRANLKKFGTDKNKDGVLQLSELKEGANIPKGYKSAYRSAFGDVDEDKIAFSPRVVGLLNTYGMDNIGLSLEQINQGAGYITDEDLVSNAKFKGSRRTDIVNSRDEILMERLRPRLDEFTEMTRNAQADVGGAKANLNLFDTSLEQRQAFVDSAALNLAQSEELLRTLRLGGRGDYSNERFGADGVGQDLSSLVGQSRMNKLNKMQQLRASIETSGGDLDLKTDTQEKLSYLNSYGISADEWTDFLKEVRSSEKKNKSNAVADELLGLKEEGS